MSSGIVAVGAQRVGSALRLTIKMPVYEYLPVIIVRREWIPYLSLSVVN